MGQINRRQLGTSDSPQIILPADYALTDFGQLRVANPRRLLDLTQIDELNTDVVSVSTVNGATVTHEQATSSLHVEPGAANGAKAVISTAYQRYSAGAAQQLLLTGWQEQALLDGQRLRIGYFDTNDGLFFEATGAGVSLVRRTSTSGVAVDEATPTDLTFADLLGHTIYEIRFRYLGHGPARFYRNTIKIADLVFEPEQAPFMRSARLPLRCEVENLRAFNLALETPGTFHFQCAAAVAEGGSDIPMRTFGTAQAVASVTTAETGLLAIRLSALYAGIVNRGQVLPLTLSVGSETQRGRFTVRWRPTLLLPDAGWSAVDATSRVERRSLLTGGSAPSNFGIPLASFFVGSGQGLTVDLSPLFDPSARIMQVDPLSGAQGVLLVTGQNENTGSTAQFVSLTWGERT